MLSRASYRAWAAAAFDAAPITAASRPPSSLLLRRRALPSIRRASGAAAPLPRPSPPASRPAPGSRACYSSSSASAAAEAPAEAAAGPALAKPDGLDGAESEIWDRLARELRPAELAVRDISGGCGSMYGIEVSSERFRGRGVLQQQRMVNAVLGDLMKGWHGVQLKTRVP